MQTFLFHEQLLRHFSDKLPWEPYKSYFKSTTNKNVIQDPDVPNGYDADAPEYAFLITFYNNSLLEENPLCEPSTLADLDLL